MAQPPSGKAAMRRRILLFVALLFSFSLILGQEFQIKRVQLTGPDRAVIEYESETNATFVLLRGDAVTNISTVVATNAGQGGLAQFNLLLGPEVSDQFFQIKRQSASAQGPVAPNVRTPPAATREASVLLSGTAAAHAQLRVDAKEGTAAYGAAGADGSFSIDVPLQPNKLNRLFLTASDSTGNLSAPRTVEVLQDSQPPSLFIDYPTNNQAMTVEKVVIAGRVGDLLSGFMGLDVRVLSSPSEGAAPTVEAVGAVSNWPAANVIVGIGNNGTFERGDVPLAPGRNVITVVATDVLGNSIARQVTLTRTVAAGPRMVAASGDRQTASVHERLPAPIVVKVTQDDGVTPLPNKLVTFEVTRSDGRLVPSQPGNPTAPGTNVPASFLQLPTDSAGLVRAFWTLGGDAGCGNNRVSVSSRDISGSVFFCASANPAPASQINVSSGNNQKAEAGGVAPESLRVWVNDSCNGVAGIPVVFSVLRGGGKIRDASNTGSLPGTDVTILSSITGHAAVELQLGANGGENVVEATFPDNPGAAASFSITGLTRDPSQVTSFSGLVLDNTSQPIGGAQCLLSVGGANFFAESGADGRFLFSGIPAGPANLQVNGLEASSLAGKLIVPGSYPALSFSPVIIPNTANSLPKPVLLPHLNPSNAQTYDGTKNVELTCEGIAGLKMVIKAGSMRRVDGSIPSPKDPATVALNPVHTDSVPMPIPDGAAPQFTWTLQPGGARFDPPVEIQYPNMSGLPAGTVAFFLSFNHDTEKFEIVASGHVTADGSTIVTDPGVGLTVAGWGCNCPPYSVTGSCTNGFPRTVVRDTTGPTNPPPSTCTTVCLDNGRLTPGTTSDNELKSCPLQPITFTAPPVNDSGGTLQKICTNPDGSTTTTVVPIPATAVSYDWTAYGNGLAVASGSGNSATIVPAGQGEYFCIFTAKAQRACPPSPLELPPQRATVLRIDLSMQDLAEENQTGSNVPHETNPGPIVFMRDTETAARISLQELHAGLAQTGTSTNLEPFFLTISPNPGKGTVTLTVPAGTKVWKDRDRTATKLSWDLATETLPDVLYVEGVQPGGGNLVATYSGDTTCQDTVKVNVVKAVLLLGAENENDVSLNDDWVGANGHTILNYIKVFGPPGLTLDLSLDYEVKVDVQAGNVPSEGTITILLPRHTVTIGANGIGTLPFEIHGGHRSTFTEDINVRAKYKDKVVAEETLTVLEFHVVPNTDGKGAAPLNPAIVNSTEAASGGNLFGTTGRAPDNSKYDPSDPGNSPVTFAISDSPFSLPSTSGSPKIDPAIIEVLWGREANGQFLDSDHDAGLAFPSSSPDRANAAVTGLRMIDTSLAAGLVSGTTVTYYVGHRSSTNLLIAPLPLNNIGSVTAKVLPHLTYPVVLHLLVGPTNNSGLSAAQASAIMADVNRIWSQAGISFTIVSNVTENLTSNDLLDATTSSKVGLGYGDATDISFINPEAGLATRAIDIYFVHIIYDSSSKGPTESQLNGFTIIPTNDGIIRKACVIIAGPSSGAYRRTTASLPRTVAHELGHYLMDSSSHAEPDQLWNLMRAGGLDPDTSETKRDLTEDQANLARTTTPPGSVK